jgi:hypothetical protein
VNFSSPSGTSLIDDPAYPALKRHVIESTGLSYYLNKDNDLAFRLGARLSHLGWDNCGEYLRLLTGNEQAGSETNGRHATERRCRADVPRAWGGDRDCNY